MFRLASVLVLVSACALAACEGDAGAAGDVSLVRIEAEPKGENCPFGGTRIMSGLDLDRDGVLSDDEAGPAQYVCDGLGTRVDDTWEGHFIAAGPIDLMLLAEIRHITGDLFIEEAFYRTVNFA